MFGFDLRSKSHRMIQFLVNRYPDIKNILGLYENAQMVRPVADEERIARMFINSNLVISAWDGGRLVGLVRALTDQCYSCYVSDLAVDAEYRGRGIGLKLMELISDHLGPEVTVFAFGREKEELWKKLQMQNTDEFFFHARMK